MTNHQKAKLFEIAGEPSPQLHEKAPIDPRYLVKSLHRTLRDHDGNSSLIERFDELTKIIYCKIHDERRTSNRDKQAAFDIGKGDAEAKTGRRIRSLLHELVKRTPNLFPQRFADFKISDTTIGRLAETMKSTQLSDVSGDLKGLVYEEIIKNTFDKGENQQFFTPREIVEFMVKMVGDSLRGTVCDPACGTGGFLLYVQEYLKQQGVTNGITLQGFEIDERLAWVTGINLDMNEPPYPFSCSYIEPPGTLGTEMISLYGTVDAIITNPPFGSDLSDHTALAELQLGRGRTSRRRGVLFVERCIDLLKPGGILAIIIDDSVLNSASNADTRRMIIERSHPSAVVSLPDVTFMPYASVKASILFLRKRDDSQSDEMRGGTTFFAHAAKVGRKPNGDPLYISDTDSGLPRLDSSLPEILKAWRTEQERWLSDGAAQSQNWFWATVPTRYDREFDAATFRLDPIYHNPDRYLIEQTLNSSAYPLTSLRDVCTVRQELASPWRDGEYGETVTYLGLANIEPRTGANRPEKVTRGTLRSSVNRFLPGDIVFAKMRPELRKVCLITEEVGEGFVSGECLVLTPKIDPENDLPTLLPELLAILLRSDLIHNQTEHLVTGIGRPRLSKNAVLNVRVPIPPPAVQRRLLDNYRHSDGTAKALDEEAHEAIRQAVQIRETAERTLTAGVLMPEGPFLQ